VNQARRFEEESDEPCDVEGRHVGTWRSGTGRPLVLVHGSPADHSALAQLIPYLEHAVSVCAMSFSFHDGRAGEEHAPHNLLVHCPILIEMPG
jgi:hypothetical protein